MRIHELGHVVLYVTDIGKVADFYAKILGFGEIIRKGPIALFSSGRTHHEMLLIEVGGSPKARTQEPGLYHIGFKIGNSHEELRAAYHELLSAGVSIIGTADHTVTHSIYVLDPDGNELELYADVSEVWKKDSTAFLAPTRPLSLD